MNFSKHIFRCSQLGKIMTEPQAKEEKEKGILGKTCKSYLRELYRELKYDRRREYSSKHIEKGKNEEEAAITLFSRVKKTYFKKNTTRLKNEYLTGEPDLFKGKVIESAEEGWDLKCSWDLFTFPYAGDSLNKDYFYQNHGYMDLTGAKKWTTAYTLVNASADMVMQEKKNTWYKLGCPDESNMLFQEKCIEIEKNMIFDYQQFINDYPGYDFTCKDWKFDIPMAERIMEFTVERDEAVIKSIYSRIEKCRSYLSELAGPSIIIAEHDSSLNTTIVSHG